MKFWKILAVLLIVSCASTPEMIKIKSHEQYSKLNKEERDLIEKIMAKAISSPRKSYYFSKLNDLLNTPTSPASETDMMNRAEIDESLRLSKEIHNKLAREGHAILENYVNKEEFYEIAKERRWKIYRPYSDSAYFYISDDDPLDLLVHIQVRMSGPYEVINKILLIEDMIEKHASLDGFSVNLVFVGYPGNDVFDVDVDPKKWTTNYNWAGGHTSLAHELFHLMGLSDEYDRIEAHATNRDLPILNRLDQFYQQMGKELLHDSMYGIMCWHNKKPLQRHVCSAVGLSDECVMVRNSKYR